MTEFDRVSLLLDFLDRQYHFRHELADTGHLDNEGASNIDSLVFDTMSEIVKALDIKDHSESDDAEKKADEDVAVKPGATADDVMNAARMLDDLHRINEWLPEFTKKRDAAAADIKELQSKAISISKELDRLGISRP